MKGRYVNEHLYEYNGVAKRSRFLLLSTSVDVRVKKPGILRGFIFLTRTAGSEREGCINYRGAEKNGHLINAGDRIRRS